MRGSLRGVRSRVERIAAQVVRDGCYVCQEDEAQVRFLWRDVLAKPPVSFDDVLANAATTKTCRDCGRTYVLRYTVLSWQESERA